METMLIPHTKVYALVLNPMQGNTENCHLAALSYEKQKLIDYHNSFLAPEPYVDEGAPSFECHGSSHNWHKSFTKGSPLEWMNPCDNFDEPNRHGQGIVFQWIDSERLGGWTAPFID